jgi:hypothetical protein
LKLRWTKHAGRFTLPACKHVYTTRQVFKNHKFSFLSLKSTFSMRKIKIMLLSLCVLAAVGGALAFKARFVFDACTAQALINGGCPVAGCPNIKEFVTTTNGAGVLRCTGLPILRTTDFQPTCIQENGQPVPCVGTTIIAPDL